MGQPGAEAHPGPGRERHPPARVAVRGRAGGAPGGRNVFADARDRYGLSETGYHFIGGLLAHLPALTALTCGSVNSYRRLAPQTWSSAYTVYGMDNREAAVRIASALRGDPASSVNLELKPSDSAPTRTSRWAGSSRPAWTAFAASSIRVRR